jgi:predicted transcriptional regulator
MISAFTWNEERSRAAVLLAQGHTQKEVAEEAGVTDRTIRNWLEEQAFSEEVDRLSLMIGVASRAHRLRLAQRVIRQKIQEDGTILTEKDLLEWVKFAQSETDGVKLDLTKLAALAQNEAPVADSGSAGVCSNDGISAAERIN